MTKGKSPKPFEIGASVQWNWMGRKVKGSIKKVYLKPVEKMCRDFLFKRNGSAEKPAYLVRSAAGNEVLKLHSELALLK